MSILKKSPTDQYSLYRQAKGARMSEITRIIADLQQKKIIHIAKYRKSERTGLDIPIYSLSAVESKRLDVHSLLAGVTSERLVEYDFLARNLVSRTKRAKILDVGAAKSELAKAINEYGKKWDVLGIDLIQGTDILMDAKSTGFRGETFDQVISISTIEHIGRDFDEKSGDIQAMQEIYRIMKKGGVAIITVPYGKSTKPDHKVYDRMSLAALVSPFKVMKKEFYRYDAGKWIKCSQAAADRINSPVPLHLHSVVCACLLLKKQ